MPGYYSLGVSDPTNPDIALPHGNLRPDGMAPEFTVAPTSDVETMIERLRDNLRATKQIVEQNGCKLSVEPQFHTDFWYINALPKSFGDSCSLQILGCAPDECIYDLPKTERPDPRTYPFRTSGGHVHVEIGTDIVRDKFARNYFTAALDLFMGTAATYLCTSQQAYERKKLYGQAGMIRRNEILGTIEYRTLSAQALLQTPELARAMFTMAQAVGDYVVDAWRSLSPAAFKQEMRTKIGAYEYLQDHVATAINTHDVDWCRQIQSDASDRFSSHDIIVATVDKLQAYQMPETFDLMWEL